MSYEIIKKIKVDAKNNVIMMECASNNVSPRTYRWAEWDKKREGKEETPFDQKITNIFESAFDGCIRLNQSCGKFYKIYTEMTERYKIFIREMRVRGLDNLDWMYGTRFDVERRIYFARQCTYVYYGKPLDDINEDLDKMLSKMQLVKDQKEAEYFLMDKIAIRCASCTDVWKNKVVLIDFRDNIYIADSALYDNRGTLREGSKAICLGNPTHLGSLFDSLRGCLVERTTEEILSYYKTPIDKASRACQFELVEKFINEHLKILPKMDMLPWKDFNVATA